MPNSEIILVDTVLDTLIGLSPSQTEPQGWETQFCSEGESGVRMLGKPPNYLLQSSSLTGEQICWPKTCFLLSSYVLSTSLTGQGSDRVGALSLWARRGVITFAVTMEVKGWKVALECDCSWVFEEPFPFKN